MSTKMMVGIAFLIISSLLCACSRTAAPTPDLDAAVQTAIAATRVAEAATATAMALSAAAQAPTATSTMALPTAPPTSTPATVAPTPTPTPAIEELAESDVDGSDGTGKDVLVSQSSSNSGRVLFFPNFTQAEVQEKPLVFRERFTARVIVSDIRLPDKHDGSGIANVHFAIDGPNGLHRERTEEHAPFCLLGGDDPTCPGINPRQQRDQWPVGQYSATITINALAGEQSLWFWQFCLDACEEVTTAPAALVVNLRQIGPGSLEPLVRSTLVFQVEAFDQTVGNQDGDGIANVLLQILGPDSTVLYERQENNTGYCAFSGGEPDCNRWIFAEHNFQWPNGQSVQDGPHTLRATANAIRGGSKRADFVIDIELNTELVPSRQGLVAAIVQTGVGRTDTTVNGELVFQVAAHDPNVGNRDGDGIANVDLQIYGPDGALVYEKRESNAGYCAFGGGEPNCTVLDLAGYGDQWPDGQPMQRGTHRLHAIVHGQNGDQVEVETAVDLSW
ncbi:MAG: hypothetical protein R3C14_04725 [Caldilineaceae bacterium]